VGEELLIQKPRPSSAEFQCPVKHWQYLKKQPQQAKALRMKSILRNLLTQFRFKQQSAVTTIRMKPERHAPVVLTPGRKPKSGYASVGALALAQNKDWEEF
jgi:hypothetical protein